MSTCKRIQDSLGFRIPRHGFRIPGAGFQSFWSEWNLDSGFQSLVGFQILCDLYSGFQSLGFRNPEANFPRFRNPDCLTWAEKLGLTQSVSAREVSSSIRRRDALMEREGRGLGAGGGVVVYWAHHRPKVCQSDENCPDYRRKIRSLYLFYLYLWLIPWCSCNILVRQ